MARTDDPQGGAASPAGAGDPLVGRMVAEKYRVQALVARGGMGRIYRAEQIPLGRLVAIKLLTPAENDPTLYRRFLREAATYARLSHPNTVSVHDYGTVQLGGEETCYIVLEWVPGRTLSQALREEGPMSAARVAHITREMCRSLREAHALGIIHRDLKPSNVMLVDTDEGESVKVLDFGVAKALHEASEVLTSAESFVGTPRYTSPEQIRQEDVDARSDIYSLGILMFEMLCGAPPFGPGEPLRVLYAHLNQPVPALADRGARDVPPELEAVIRRCLAKTAAERFPDVDALMNALRAAFPQDDTHTNKPFVLPPLPEPSSPSLATQPVARRLGWVLVGGAVLGFLAVVAIMIGGFLWLVREDPAPTVVEAPVVAPPPQAPPQPVAAKLTVSSVPDGAEVWDGDARLGVTPLALQVDVARTVEVRRKGYLPQRLALTPGAEPDPVLLRPTKAPPKPPGGPAPDIRLER